MAMDQSGSKHMLLRVFTVLLAVGLLFAGFGAAAAVNDKAPAQKKPAKKTAKAAAIRQAPVKKPVEKTADPGKLQAQVKTAAPAAKAPAKNWSVAAVYNRVRNLYDRKDGSFSESNDFYLVGNLSLAEKWRLSALGAYSQNVKKPETADWADTQVTLSRKAEEISTNFKMGYGALAIVAHSKNSTIRQNMNGAAGGLLNFGFNDGVLTPGLNLGLSFSLTRLFYAYETNIDGQVLSPWSFKQTFSAGYSVGKFSFSGSFIHRNAFTFQDNMKEAFEHSQEIGYTVTPNFSVAVGHYLSGGAFKPNGFESNYSLTDEENSQAYVSIAVSY
ncbi:MAG: hypothetical protein KF865_01235 [Bdellovibrionaceae bacterium]|nr:hypothetical protein [Pseudobdellovibrionaceae bacterium]